MKQLEAEGPMVVAAVASIPASAEVAEDSGLPADWKTGDPTYIGGSRNEEVVRSVLSGVGAWMEKLPIDDLRRYRQRVADWIAAYEAFRVVEHYLAAEGLASSLAMTKETRPAFPRDDATLERLQHRAGATLASGEFPALNYSAATLVSGMVAEDQLTCLSRLYENAAHVARSGL